ncbi:unnamed protein product [Lactuca virosa]|uniref:Protein ENDOSPERM DEFECTIVE 1 n=1 Tax=Lactuca virosa TaxID=75947 RepID=A0AAU9MDV7_9ASTR|nr:unnamed protein product [Lactuca virosa]
MSNSIAAVVPGSTADQGAPPPPPLPHRRPRVREVSSRFMSPAASSSAGDLHSLTMKSPISRSNHSVSTPVPERSSKPSPSQRRLVLRSHEHEPLSSSASFSSSHENIPETFRSMDTPFQHAKPDTFPIHRKQSAKENGFGVQKFKSTSLRTGKSSRSDTPIATTDRIVPSRFRLPQRQTTSSSVTDAAKLLQSTGLSFSSSNLSSNNDTAIAISQSFVESQPPSNESEQMHGGSTSCPNSPISSQHTRTWPLPDTRSSMTAEDTLSTRLIVRSSSCSSTTDVGNCPPLSKFSSSSLCSRSLNLSISSCQNSFKSNSLPPQPTSMKLGVDSRKARKPQSSQEDIHSLKLLHNHYLQWRYANAKAQVTMQTQKTSMENQLFSFGADIAHLRETVKKKQAELAILQRIKAVSTIIEAQMPYLDEWSGLEEDYTCSLSGTTSALTNSLLRLPVTGNVQVNIKEAAEALDSAVKTTEMIVDHMQTFLPKAEEMDSLSSELATVINIEKALVEECGNLLANTHTSQVKECSIRGHLIQLHCSNVSKQ